MCYGVCYGEYSGNIKLEQLLTFVIERTDTMSMLLEEAQEMLKKLAEGEIELLEWHNYPDEKPPTSGRYIVWLDFCSIAMVLNYSERWDGWYVFGLEEEPNITNEVVVAWLPIPKYTKHKEEE